MKRMVLATGNAGKLREFSALLAEHDIELVSQTELQVPEVAETGLSFVENAILKARNAARHTGLPALADDSGLAVAALDGAPGIYSARYAGPQASDRQNLEKLLARLEAMPGRPRTARFICVLALLRHADDPVPLICQGVWTGVIAEAPRGDGGFGYDPVFYLPELDKTAAELAAEQKNRLSHRAKALAGLLQALAAEALC